MGLSIPTGDCRRCRLWRISRYSKMAMANSSLVFHRRRFSSSTTSRLLPLLPEDGVLAALFVSPSCGACHAAIEDLRGYLRQHVARLRQADVSVAVLSRGNCPASDPVFNCLEAAHEEHDLLRVVATPFVLVVNSVGTILNAGLVSSRYPLRELIESYLTPKETPTIVEIEEMSYE